jgi:hypothetical protein
MAEQAYCGERLMAALDGARLVKYDTDGVLYAWFGAHGVHTYNAAGVEVDYWSVGDFAQDAATLDEVERSIALRIRGVDEDGVDEDGRSERDRIEARGYSDGHAAATWFEIPDEETARRILAGIDEGDPEILDAFPAPRLGGEFADDPTWSDVLGEESCEDSDDGRPELLGVYEYAFACASEREIVRSCRFMLDLVPHDLGPR